MVALGQCPLDIVGDLRVVELFSLQGTCFSSYLLNLKSSKARYNLGCKSRDESSLRRRGSMEHTSCCLTSQPWRPGLAATEHVSRSLFPTSICYFLF